MHDAEPATIHAVALVRVVQALRGARDDREHAADRDQLAHRVRAMQQRAHGLAVHVLHREEVAVAEAADVVHLRDVRVLELGREPRLVEEHAHEVDVGRALAEDPLEHDVARHAGDARAARQKDLRHATHRELREDLVTVGGRAYLGRCGHAAGHSTSIASRSLT